MAHEFIFWNKRVKIRTRKGFQNSLFQAVFYTFAWNILGMQCCVTCVEDDCKIVIVQEYRTDEDVDKTFLFNFTCSRQFPKIVKKGENMRKLQAGLFTLFLGQLFFEFLLFGFALFKSFRDPVYGLPFFQSNSEILNGFICFFDRCF